MVLTFDSGYVLEHPPLNNMVRALDGDGVIQGFHVTERGAGANMSVDVASGSARINNIAESESGTTNLVIAAAHATLERKDLVTYDASGDTPAVIQGTDHAGTEADPTYPPDIPYGDILLGIVKVGAAASSIVTGDITDGRIYVPATYIIHKCTASDVLRDSEDAITNISQTSYTKELEITVPAGIISGTLRIKFAMNETASGTSYGKIYKNGVALGSQRSTLGATYTTYSEDLSDWQEGDTIELWAYHNAGSGNGNVKEFRVYCDYDTISIVPSVTW